MNNFTFYSPTEFVFGKGREYETGALVRKYGSKKVMIVYGGGSVVRSGLLERVTGVLKSAGVEYCLMGGVQPNPIDTKVYEGIA
ncbi:MAG: iron-containing alcohol dehydrogenase, partial [Barnesiella sp.]